MQALTKHLVPEKLVAALEAFLMIYLIYKTCNEQNISDSQNFQMELQPINESLLPNNTARSTNRRQLKKILMEQKNRCSKFVFKYLGIVVLYTVFLFYINQKIQNSLIIVIVKTPYAKTEDFSNETQAVLLNNQDPKAQFQSYHTNFQSKLHYMGSLLNFDKSAPEKVRTVGLGYFNHFTSCLLSTLPCFLIHLVMSYLCSKSVAQQTAAKDAEKQKHGYVFVRQSDKMSSKKMWSCMKAGFFAGAFVSLLGIGGSIVLVPVLIMENIDQQTATDSSTVVTFFSSIISILATAFHFLYYQHIGIALLYFILSGFITLLTYSIFKSMAGDNINKRFMKKIKLILYISTSIFVTPYFLILTFIADRGFD